MGNKASAPDQSVEVPTAIPDLEFVRAVPMPAARPAPAAAPEAAAATPSAPRPAADPAPAVIPAPPPALLPPPPPLPPSLTASQLTPDQWPQPAPHQWPQTTYPRTNPANQKQHKSAKCLAQKDLCRHAFSSEDEDSDNAGGVTKAPRGKHAGYPLDLSKLQKKCKYWWEEMYMDEKCDQCNRDKKGVRPIVLVGTGEGKEQIWLSRCMYCNQKEEINNDGAVPKCKVAYTQTSEKDFEWIAQGAYMEGFRNTGRGIWA